MRFLRLLGRILCWVTFVAAAAYAFAMYVVPPIRQYNIFWLQTFDYGILYNSSQELAFGRAPLLTTRGTHAWADNQDYLQILFAPLHWLPAPHYSLLTIHSLAIWACGVFVFWFLRRGWTGLCIAVFVWLSPYMINMAIDLFHTEAFATIFLLLMFAAAVAGRRTAFFVSALLALSCKEDVAITVAGFMALAFLRPTFFRLGRSDFVVGFAVACAVFALNVGVVLPHYKQVTCEWLGAEIPTAQVGAAPAAPWFGNIWKDLRDPAFYRWKILIPEVRQYLLLLLWPLVPFLRSTFPMCLLPLGGVAVNVLGGGYLIQSQFHYDHSTFAGVIIVVLLGLSRARYPLVWGVLLAGITVWVNVTVRNVRVRLRDPMNPQFWEIKKDDRTRFVEALSRRLPTDIVLATDYTSNNYLLPGRQWVYMLDNPFRPDYFGIYDLCDGNQRPYTKIPMVDLVVMKRDARPKPEVMAKLDAGFERWRVKLNEGGGHMDLLVNPQSPQADRLRGIAQELGAERQQGPRGPA